MTDRNANRSGYRKTQIGWIPEEWNCVLFGTLADFSNGLNFLKHESAYPIKVVGVSDFQDRRVADVTISETIFVDRKPTKDALLQEGDLLFVRSNGSKALVGRCLLIPALREEVSFSGFTIRARLHQPSASAEYISHLMRSDSVRRQLHEFGGGTNISNLSQDILNGLRIVIPPEHAKIAAILSAWDEAIEQTRALTAVAKRRKKALMQQLLTGRKRLPGFAVPWKKMSIGVLLEEVERPVTWADDATYCLLSVRRASGGAFLREERRGSEILTKTMFQAKAGDFLISKMQVLHGAMALVPEHLDGMHISGSYIALRPRSTATIDSEFFTMLSSTPEFYHLTYLSSYGVHIEKMTFNLEWFLQSIVRIPTNISEQRAITAVLTTADEAIKTQEAKCTALERQKKGLMQKLLTGEVRMKP